MIKERIKQIKILKPLIFIYRRLRFTLYSYLKLPKIAETPIDGKKVIFNTRNSVTADFCRWGNFNGKILDYEPFKRKIFIQYAKESKIVFDLGTRVGYYAIIAAKLGADKVIAFDVNKEFIEIAKKQAKLNNVLDRIEFLPLAIGKDNEEIVVENFNSIDKLKSISLDTFCSQRSIWPDFMKIDIDGFEFEALEGAKILLEKYKPIFLLEFNPLLIKNRNKNPRETFDMLLISNYSIFKIKESGLLENVSSFEDCSDNSNELICIPNKKQ